MIVGISGVALAGILVGLSRSYGWMIIFLVLMESSPAATTRPHRR